MMFLFVWVVLPSGALMAAMMASGSKHAMSLASKCLATPVRMGALQLSIPVFMIAVSGIFALVNYAGMSRNEARRDAGQDMAGLLNLSDRQQMKVAFAARNFYISLLGLALWVTAWRLKVLFDQQRLTPAGPPKKKAPLMTRIFYVAIGIMGLLLADIPICRLNYNLQLMMFITPQKANLEYSAGPCEPAYLASATDVCAEFCAGVKHLSEERLATIMWARNWHPLGKVGAEFFDGSRGVEQGEERIRELFLKKTCAQVLKGVDKSNVWVNWFCIAFAVVAVMGAFSALSNAAGGADNSNEAAGNEAKRD